MGNAVKNYYDNNTRYFLKYGQHYLSANIHQALWAPEVKTKLEAVNYSNFLILQEIQKLSQVQHILDLGCGVGSSLLYLKDHLEGQFQFTGISISAEQIKIAQQFAAKAEGKKKNIQFIAASFQNLPEHIQDIDLAYSIEAFVHSPNGSTYFKEASKALKSKGKLILIDDFLSEEKHPSNQYNKTIRNFKKGWHLGSLLEVDEIVQMAKQQNLQLIKRQNLTPWHAKNRLRDHLLHWSLPLMLPSYKRSTYGLSLLGGDARWQALRKNWINYELLVFEKSVGK